MKAKKKTSKIFSFRLPEEEGRILDIYSELFHIPISKLIRRALGSYIIFQKYNLNSENPHQIFSRTIISSLFNSLNEEELRNTAHLSYESGIEMKKRAADFPVLKEIFGSKKELDPNLEMDLNLIECEKKMKYFSKHVFSKTAQNWLEEFHGSWNKELVVLKGRHQNGQNFSRFMRYFLEYHMLDFSYALKSCNFPGENNIIKQEKSSKINSSSKICYFVLKFCPKKEKKESKKKINNVS